MPCEFQRTKAECMQLFVRAARRKFSKSLQFFCAILAQRVRDLDAERALFRIRIAFSTQSTSATFCNMRSARWPSARSFFVRAACRNSGNFGIKFFARVWQKNCVTWTPDAHLFTFGLTFDSLKRCNDVLRLTQRMRSHAGRVRAISLRAARQNSGKFAIISRDFCAKICVISTRHYGFFALQRTSDSVKSCNEVLRFCATDIR